MAKRRVRLPTEMEGALSAEVAEQRDRIADLEAEVGRLREALLAIQRRDDEAVPSWVLILIGNALASLEGGERG